MYIHVYMYVAQLQFGQVVVAAHILMQAVSLLYRGKGGKGRDISSREGSKWVVVRVPVVWIATIVWIAAIVVGESVSAAKDKVNIDG